MGDVDCTRTRTHGIPSESTEYGSVNLTAPCFVVVTIATERICRVPPDDSDRGVNNRPVGARIKIVQWD